MCAIAIVYFCQIELCLHFQTGTVDHQPKLMSLLDNWKEGDLLVTFSPDR